jgi:hypothetical protein
MSTDASSLISISSFSDIVSQWPFWTGLGSVMLFSLSRFNVTLPDIDELSPPLRPRSFTTAFRFWLAAFVYIGCYSSLYLALVVIGLVPQLSQWLTGALGAQNPQSIGTPAWAALVATAVLPALPWISSIDASVRAHLQDFASIPGKARIIAREVLAALNVPEPAAVGNNASLRRIGAAISAHRARFDQLWLVWPKLKEIDDSLASRRFSGFFRENQKVMDGFKQEFSSGPANLKLLDPTSAMYLEQKFRQTLKKVARLMVCSMLEAESTEFRVREHWRSLGIQIQPGGLDFQLKNIITSLFGIAVAVLLACYLSAIVFHVVEVLSDNTSLVSPLSEMLSQNRFLFLSWSAITVLIYLPPITIAAGTAMYLLDRVSTGATLTFTDYATAAVLTFAASATLCFFVLLGYGVLYPTILKQPPSEIHQLAPWTIPAALVATTFMLLSSWPRSARASVSETLLYVLCLSGIAVLGALMAHFLAGPPRPDRVGTLPVRSIIYLIVIAPASIGACLGWLLSGTRHPRVQKEPRWQEQSFGEVEQRARGVEVEASEDEVPNVTSIMDGHKNSRQAHGDATVNGTIQRRVVKTVVKRAASSPSRSRRVMHRTTH